MSSFLCFVCHSTVNADTNEDTREKYREVVGMSLCPDSHLCFICCHLITKMWLFKSICLKRTLEYPVLFSERGTINLQRSDMTVAILCPEDICLQHLNTRYHFFNNTDYSHSDFEGNNYCEERQLDLQLPDNIEDYQNEDYIFSTKGNPEDDLFSDDLILPNLEPVKISQDDLVNDEWSKNDTRSDKKTKYDTVLLELDNFRNNDDNMPIFECTESQIVNSIDVEIDTNIYDNIENELKKVEEIDIDESIDDFNGDIDSNANKDAETKLADDLDIITADINEIDPLSNPKVRKKYDNFNTVAVEVKEIDPLANSKVINKLDDLNTIDVDVNDIDSHSNSKLKKKFDDLDIITADINEIDPLSNPKVRKKYEHVNTIATDINKTQPQTKPKERKTFFAEILAEHSKVVENSMMLQKKMGKRKDFEKISLTVKEQKLELEQARRDEKYVSASFKCHSCAMYFHFKDTHQAHMMRHEESNGEHCCPICSLRFSNPAVMRQHAANHAERFQCTQCEELVKLRQRPTHLRICTGKITNCMTCHLCGQAFPGVTRLNQHLQRFHKTTASKRNYLCNICGNNFENRNAVRTHMLSHVARKFDCDECPSTFNSPYTLNQHKKKHVRAEPEWHHCDTCNLSYSTRKSLMAHMRNALAHKDAMFKCSVCNRVCPSQASLDAHTLAVHARTKHLFCDMCPAKYSTKKTLASHISRAHSEKTTPVPKKTRLCHACGENFTTISNLKRHLKRVCYKDRLEEMEIALLDL